MLTAQARFRRRSLAWIGWVLPALGLLVIVFMWAYVLHSLEAERDRVVADSYARARSLNRAFEAYTERGGAQVVKVNGVVAEKLEHRGRGVEQPRRQCHWILKDASSSGAAIAVPRLRGVSI